VLRQDYRQKIAGFMQASAQWLQNARQEVVSDVGNDEGLELMTVYVLFEQDAERSLYGLLFNVDADREHGRGMMLDGEDFSIVKYGEGSVAFEG
jgi:hypothetical protein